MTEITIINDKKFVPIWEKFALTIDEVAEYSNIGICKLNEILKKPNCPFVLYSRKKETRNLLNLNARNLKNIL